MALLLIEGFEGFGTTVGTAPQPTGTLGRAYNVAFESNMDIETGRLGGYCIEFDNTGCEIQTKTLTTDDTLIIGFAIKFTVLTDHRFLYIYDDAIVNMQLRLTATGQIEFYTTILQGTSAAIISTNTWYHIEVKVKTDNAAGTYEIRVGGVNVLSDTGIDTKNGTHDYSNIIKFQMISGLGFVSFDDIYICDSTGAQNNNFLNNCKVISILPDGDDAAGWDTASGGAAHHLDIDENPADDDTTYIETDAVGEKDLFDYAAMATATNIKGIEIKTMCRETDATNYSLITPIKSNITETDDSAQAIGTMNYTFITRISELDPDTSAAWLEAGINAAKFGVKVG